VVRIKICGITNLRDASMAAELGADALGFVFAPSPRKVTPQQACRIIKGLPPFVQTVGVFVDEGLKSIRDIVDFCGLEMIQLQGDESPEFCSALMPHTIKGFRLNDSSSLLPIGGYRGKIRAVLLDAYQKGKRGGTGKTFDWNLATVAKEFEIPVILSGGLNPSNIQRAVAAVQPYAVDVSTGVEESPGVKSPLSMKTLIEKIRELDNREERQ
jgi:phosphoribosylanthranilate isomerase